MCLWCQCMYLLKVHVIKKKSSVSADCPHKTFLNYPFKLISHKRSQNNHCTTFHSDLENDQLIHVRKKPTWPPPLFCKYIVPWSAWQVANIVSKPGRALLSLQLNANLCNKSMSGRPSTLLAWGWRVSVEFCLSRLGEFGLAWLLEGVTNRSH